MTKRVRVIVTQQDYNKAIDKLNQTGGCGADSCPVAQAVRRLFPKAIVWVSKTMVYVDDLEQYYQSEKVQRGVEEYYLSERLQRAVEQFDTFSTVPLGTYYIETKKEG